jgi:kynurenine formamidase
MSTTLTTRLLSLSYPLSPSAPLPDGGHDTIIKATSRVEAGDISDTNLITFWNHAGTHMDGPAHVLAKVGPISKHLPIEGLRLTRAAVVDVPCDDGRLITAEDFDHAAPFHRDCDIIFIRTGYSRFRATDPQRYRAANPGLDPSAAHWLLQHCPNLKCLGIDTISVASLTNADHLKAGIDAHKILLGAQPPRFLIEDLNLDQDLSAIERVYVVPFMIEGIDSCPCNVLVESRA